MRRYANYSSLNDSNRLFEVERRQRRCVAGTQREIAHLSFDAARVAPATAGGNSLLQNLFEDSLMKRFPVQRGE